MIRKASAVYFSLIFLVIYVPDWQVIDMKSVQWYYLSIVNFIFLSFFFLRTPDILKKVRDPIVLSFFSLVVISSISVIWALNRVEAVVRLTDLFTILITLFITVYIVSNKLIDIKYLLLLFLISLSFDAFGVFYLYLQVLEISTYNYEFTDDIRAYYGNRNITSIAIAMKIPVVLYGLITFNNYLIRVYALTIVVLSFYVLLLLSSRAIMLSTIITIIISIVLIAIKKFKYKQTVKTDLKLFKLYLIPLITAIVIFSFAVNNEDKVSLDKRVTSIVNNKDDRSASERLRFYTGAIKYIASNPLLGCGIGNWRIMSIKYDAENMFSYIVPYFAHNDFIEIFAETGILGFFSYLMFFLFIFKLNLRNIILWIQSKSGFESILLFMPFIFYFIDSNLNFPLDRPVLQIKLIGYISLLILFNNLINKSNEEKLN
jgi:O-antigen ligase